MLGIQYFNQGFSVLVSLATNDLFKTVYNLEPGEAQRLTGIIMMPWAIKILYGLISDNLPICGSRRKSYLFVAAMVYTISMNTMVYNQSNANLAIFCLFMSNMSVAFSDVIVDSLMVIQSRRSPEDGSEVLQTWSWCCLSVGGFCGSILAAIITENYNPAICYQITGLMGFVIAIFAYRLDV